MPCSASTCILAGTKLHAKTHGISHIVTFIFEIHLKNGELETPELQSAGKTLGDLKLAFEVGRKSKTIEIRHDPIELYCEMAK